MIFNPHYNLRDKHAFLGASNYHWLNYTDDKLKDTYLNNRAKELGTKVIDEKEFLKLCNGIDLATDVFSL